MDLFFGVVIKTSISPIYSIFIGHWEVVQKLDLEEELLKLTELEKTRTEDLGNFLRRYN